jgi:hypothetical protein
VFNYGYMCYQAERPKTQAEQRKADAQVGQLFAALGQLCRSLAVPLRALGRQSGTGQPSVCDRTCQPAAGASAAG